jgi:hypothetical protein
MILCIGLMLVQVNDAMKGYFEHEIITRFEMKTQLNILKLYIKSTPDAKHHNIIINEFSKSYPEFKESMTSLLKNNLIYEGWNLTHIQILELLTENNIQKFYDMIFDPKDMIKSSHFVINQKKLIVQNLFMV